MLLTLYSTNSEWVFQILKNDAFKTNDLFLRDSVFGYIVSRSVTEFNSSTKNHCYFVQKAESIKENLNLFLDLESLGIREDSKHFEEDQTMTIFNQAMEYKDGHYIMNFPWKRNHKELDDNYCVSKKRFQSSLNELQCNPEMKSQYKGISFKTISLRVS
ncbi:hypothetical protein TNCV_4093861 [Trichonephila clavipes]|nr:hypothetical protein TNCV_4093861 [Trichonephila clavipes]